MDNNKKFSTSMFGFSKKRVNEYILNLTNDFSKKISELETRIKLYEESIGEKSEKIAILEAERSHIAETILKAKRESDELLNATHTEADGILSNAKNESENIISNASFQAETIISNAKAEAIQIKKESEKELAELENQKKYVSQCIASLKLDVLSAYEVYMLKLEKSMEKNDVISLDEPYIEVEHEHISNESAQNSHKPKKDSGNDSAACDESKHPLDENIKENSDADKEEKNADNFETAEKYESKEDVKKKKASLFERIKESYMEDDDDDDDYYDED